MRAATLPILTALTLLVHRASAVERVEPARRPVLASGAIKAVVVEARADGHFWFERCYLPGSPAKSVASQLAKASFRDCARFTQVLPDDDAARGEFNRQFSESINDQFELYGRQRGNAMVIVSTVGASLISGTLPLLKFEGLPWIHTSSGPRLLTTGVVSGLIAMIVSGWYSVEYADDFGLGREIEEALDSDLTSPDVILLDRRVRTRSLAAHAVEVFETAIAEAARATLQNRSN